MSHPTEPAPRTALLLAFDFLPARSPGAAIRSSKLAQHLPEFGWNPLVLSRDEGLPGPEPIAGVIRLRNPVSPRLSYQLAAATWASKACNHARKLAQSTPFSIIYVTCPPFPLAPAALALGRELGLPVVVDFRDAWALDPYAGGGLLKEAAQKALCRWVYPPFEANLFRHAHALLMNTPSMEREYRRIYPAAADRMQHVPNGFDETAFVDCPGPPPRKRPVFLYCGGFAPTPGRSPDVLLQGMRLALDRGVTFSLEILGDDSPLVRDAVRRYRLEASVRPLPSVRYRTAIREMCAADALVLYQAPGRTAVSAIAGKTFEYLRAGRPILSIAPEGDNTDLVRRYSPASAFVTDNDPARVAEAFATLLGRLDQGAVHPEFASLYNRRNIARQIAAVFDRLCP